MAQSKRRKTNKGGSRPGSRAATPVPQSRSSSPHPQDDVALATTPEAVPDHHHHNTTSTTTTTTTKPVIPLVLTSAKLRGVYECDYCHSDISRLPRIRCARCDDFDLCLECFLTTDHSSAIANLRASVEAREEVVKYHQAKQQQQQQQQQTNEGAVNHNNNNTTTNRSDGTEGPAGGDVAATGSGGGLSSSSWHTASGAIHHDDSHGYRVCDSTRYPMFPSARQVVPSSSSSSTGRKSTNGSVAASGSEADTTLEDDEKPEAVASMKADAEEDGDGDVMETNDDNHDDDDVAAPETEANTTSTQQLLSSDVTLIPADDLKAVWTVEEDLRLLEGIESHGLGNWSDVAEVVAGIGSVGKNPKRCMERYFDDFLGRYGHILPPYTLVLEPPNNNDESGAAVNAAEETAHHREDGDDGPAEKEGTSNTDGGTPNNTNNTTPGLVGGTVGSIVKDLDPTRLSKRKHSIMKRSSTNSTQSLNRFNTPRQLVPTESLPEYQVVRDLYPQPRVPDKVAADGVPNPPVMRGQEVGRDQAIKAELQFVKVMGQLATPEQVEAEREYWKEHRYMKPGGPTVLPQRTEDVVLLPGAELAGYMPRRGDFDIEWENDAEQTLADMEFLPGDLDRDKQLKLAVLAIYNQKLDERQNRKDFIRERNLHDYRKHQEEDARMPRDERDLVRRMRLFERFHTPQEHQRFLDDILQAKRLRKEIAKLQMYRRLGITSLAEAEKYELDKSRRNFHKVAALQNELLTKGPKAAAADAAAASKREERAEETTTSLWKGYSSTSRRRSMNRATSEEVGGPATAVAAGVEPSEGTAGAGSEPPATTSQEMTDAANQEKPKESTTTEKEETLDETKSQSAVAKTGDTIDLDDMEDAGYLTAKEKKLCRQLELTPKKYLECKSVLINESFKKGLLDKDGPNNKRTVVMIDVEKRDNVIDFMVKAGWLSSKGGADAPASAPAE